MELSPTSFSEASEPLPSVRSIVKRICQQSIPAVIGSVFNFATEIINTIFIGQYGSKEQLAAVGLGNMMQNLFGLSVGIGLAMGIDTLSSQAHGAGEDRLACVYMQRARLILSVQIIWIWPLLACCDVWLPALGLDPDVARLAKEYNSTSAPFLIFFFQNACFRRLLSAFMRPKINMWISGLVAGAHIAWVYVSVVHMDLGNMGLGLANGVSWTLRFMLYLCLLWKIAPDLGLKRRWVLGFQRDSLLGWWGYLRVGLPALLQTTSEWWFWEICTLVVGYLGATALAAHVATIQFITILFMVPIGVGSGASMLVGNAIGAGSPEHAKRIGMVSIGFVLAMWSLVALLIAAFSRPIAIAFTNDSEVQCVMRVLLLIYAVQGFFDAGQNVMSSILRGLGDMRIPSITYLITFYAVMLPLAIIFAFPCRLGVRGVWLSMGVGTGLSSIIFARTLWKKDYKALVFAAQERICKEDVKDDTTSS